MEWTDNLIRDFGWTVPIDHREEKEAVAREVAGYACNGQVIGAGSGSTVYLALLALAGKIRREKLRLTVVTASYESTMICTRLGIPQTTLWEQRPDWAMDGADEVDPRYNLIKGRGGALFKEKLLMSCSDRTYIIVDESKLVERLGRKFPVPIEVFPPALTYVHHRVKQLGARQLDLRHAVGKDGALITENGNFLLDAWFDVIDDSLERELKQITGVIESGLFIGYPVSVLVAGSSSRK